VELRDASAQETFRASVKNIKPNDADVGVFSTVLPDGTVRAARSFTRAVSHNGIDIVEYQSNGYDCTDEQNYQLALEKLVLAFSETDMDLQQKLEEILDISLAYFELDTANVAMIVGENFQFQCVRSSASDRRQVGDKLNLADTFSGQFTESKAFLSVDDVSSSAFSGLPCHEKSGIESYIGGAVNTSTGPYGSVSFSSKKSRGRAFTVQDENLILLISSWIGFLVGNREQMEFMYGQNDYYQSLFKSVPAMMFLSDADGLVISASDLLCNKLGVDPDNLPGKNCLEVFNVDNKQSFKNSIARGDAHEVAMVFSLDDNSTLEVQLDCRIKNVGSLQGVRMVVLNDVSALNQASRSAEEQNRRLEAANENLNQFAFIASHDLQEPLRKIQQFSSFLEEDLVGKLDKDTRYHLDVIVNAADRMSTLIHDLLRFSGASQEELSLEKVNLNTLFDEVRTELEMRIDEAKADITIDPLPEVKGDKGMLRQLFVNLVSNSIKYRSKERPLKITVTAMGENSQEGVVVADNGIGFEQEFAGKIFEPFNRLHGSKEYKGNGIGLAICSTVCDKHGWRLSAHGKPGVGSSFTIHF